MVALGMREEVLYTGGATEIVDVGMLVGVATGGAARSRP